METKYKTFCIHTPPLMAYAKIQTEFHRKNAEFDMRELCCTRTHRALYKIHSQRGAKYAFANFKYHIYSSGFLYFTTCRTH